MSEILDDKQQEQITDGGDEKLKKLHQNLIKDNYDLPDFVTFKNDMSDKKKLAKLRENLIKDNYELPDLETFAIDMGFGTQQNSQPKTPPQAQPLVAQTITTPPPIEGQPPVVYDFANLNSKKKNATIGGEKEKVDYDNYLTQYSANLGLEKGVVKKVFDDFDGLKTDFDLKTKVNEYNTNPTFYERSLNARKTDLLLNKILTENGKTPGEIQNIRNEKVRLRTTQNRNFEQFRADMKSYAKLIEGLNVSEQDKKQYLENILNESYIGYTDNNNLADEMIQKDPRSKFLNKTELLGLYALEDINPNLAKEYEGTFYDKKTDKNNIGQQPITDMFSLSKEAEDFNVQQKRLELAQRTVESQKKWANEVKSSILAKYPKDANFDLQINEYKSKQNEIERLSSEIIEEKEKISNNIGAMNSKSADLHFIGQAIDMFYKKDATFQSFNHKKIEDLVEQYNSIVKTFGTDNNASNALNSKIKKVNKLVAELKPTYTKILNQQMSEADRDRFNKAEQLEKQALETEKTFYDVNGRYGKAAMFQSRDDFNDQKQIEYSQSDLDNAKTLSTKYNVPIVENQGYDKQLKSVDDLLKKLDADISKYEETQLSNRANKELGGSGFANFIGLETDEVVQNDIYKQKEKLLEFKSKIANKKAIEKNVLAASKNQSTNVIINDNNTLDNFGLAIQKYNPLYAGISIPYQIEKLELTPAFFVGLDRLADEDKVNHDQVLKQINKGMPMSATEIANITSLGLNIQKLSNNELFATGKIDSQEYIKNKNKIAQTAHKNVHQNYEVFKGLVANGIAELVYSNKGDVWYVSDKLIDDYGKKIIEQYGGNVNSPMAQRVLKTLKAKEGKMIMANSIAKSDPIRSFFTGAATPIREINNYLTSKLEDDNDVTRNIKYVQSKSMPNNLIAEQGVESAKQGKYGIVLEAMQGLGSLVSQIGLSYGASGLIKGAAGALIARGGLSNRIAGSALMKSKDILATYLTSYPQSKESNLLTARTYTSNENEAEAAAIIQTNIDAFTEMFLSPLDIGKGIYKNLFKNKGVQEGILGVLRNSNIIDKKAVLTKVLMASVNAAKKGGQVALSEIGEEEVSLLSDLAINAYLNKQTFDKRNITNELIQTTIDTGISMAIPSALAGLGGAKVNRFSKQSLIIAANDRLQLIDQLNKSKFNQEISQKDYDEKVLIINSSAKALEQLDTKDFAKTLTEEQRENYVFNSVSELILNQKLAQKDENGNSILSESEAKIMKEKLQTIVNSQTIILKQSENNNKTKEDIALDKINKQRDTELLNADASDFEEINNKFDKQVEEAKNVGKYTINDKEVTKKDIENLVDAFEKDGKLPDNVKTWGVKNDMELAKITVEKIGGEYVENNKTANGEISKAKPTQSVETSKQETQASTVAPIEVVQETKIGSQTEKEQYREQIMKEEGLQLELAPLVIEETPATIKRTKEVEANNQKLINRIKEIDLEFDKLKTKPKKTTQAGSVGVGGDVVEPKKQNFTQFAKENGYPDDYDTSFQAQLLGGRGLEGKRQSNRSIKEQDDAFQEMQNKKAEGKKVYEQEILDGKVIDPEGKLTREGILKRDYDFTKKELESKIDNAKSGIKNIEGLGKMAHLDNGKLKKGYQRAVDDYNETISKHKESLDKLKTEYEQSLKEQPKVETPKVEAGSVGVDVESRKNKQLEIINKTNPAPNNTNLWVRKVEDIKTADEVFEVAKKEGAMYSDFTEQDMADALNKGEVIVYSSYPITDGVFISPSKMNAQEYAGGKGSKVYSKTVKLEDVAWLDEGEGQYAKVEQSLKEQPKAQNPPQEISTRVEEGSGGVGEDVELTQEQKVNETTKALEGIDKTDLEFISRKENNRRKSSFYEKAKGILFKGFGGNASIISDKFGSKYKYFTDNPDYAKSFSLEKEYLSQKGKVEKYETDYKKEFNTNEKDYNNEVLNHSGKKSINDLTSKDFDNFNDKLKADGYDVVNIKRNEPLIPSEAYRGHSADIRNVEVEEHLILNDKAIKKIADQPSLLENNAKSVSEAYHSDKLAGEETPLVEAVEDAIGKPKEQSLKEQPKAETTSKPIVEEQKVELDYEPKIKEAEAKYNAAKKEYDKASKKISDTQTKQQAMFESTQKGILPIGKDEAKKILDPLREKIKKAKAEFDYLLNKKKIQDEKQQELFKKEEKEEKEKNATTASINKQKYSKVREIDEPSDAYGIALSYFANGGKVHPKELLKEVVGTSSDADNRISSNADAKRLAAERKGYDLLDVNAKTIKGIAHSIWDNLPEHIQDLVTDQDIRNKLIEVIGTHQTRSAVADEFIEKYHPEEIQKQYEKEQERYYSNSDSSKYDEMTLEELNEEAIKILAEEGYNEEIDYNLNYILNEQARTNAEVSTNDIDAKKTVPNENGSIEKNETKGDKPTKTKTIVDVDKAKKIADFLRKGLIDDDILMVGVPFAKEVWNGAILAMAKSIEITADIALAIEDGIRYIKDSKWYESLSDTNKAKAIQTFEKQYSEEKINTDTVEEEPTENKASSEQTNFLEDKKILLSSEKITALSASTSEYTGVKVSDDLRESNKATLDELQKQGASWVAEAKVLYPGKTDYVLKMLRAIYQTDGKTELSITKKAVALVSLLESIDRDLMNVDFTDAERKTMIGYRNNLLGQRAKLTKDVSLALNAQRLIYKLYNGKYKTKDVLGQVVGSETVEFVDEIVSNMAKFDIEISQDAIDLLEKELAKPYDNQVNTTNDTSTNPITESKIEKNKKKYEKILKNTVSQSEYERLKNELRNIAKKIDCPKK